jgi:hypothetical protein
MDSATEKKIDALAEANQRMVNDLSRALSRLLLNQVQLELARDQVRREELHDAPRP